MKRTKVKNIGHLESVEIYEGEYLEQKIERIVNNSEPIKDGAPAIYTEKKDGVLPAFNIRTDRWDIAYGAMEKLEKAKMAKSKEKADMKIEKTGESENTPPAV